MEQEEKDIIPPHVAEIRALKDRSELCIFPDIFISDIFLTVHVFSVITAESKCISMEHAKDVLEKQLQKQKVLIEYMIYMCTQF